MAIDIQLLRILKHRDAFFKVRGRVPEAALEKTTNTVLKDVEKYFKKFPDHPVIDIPTFATLFRAWHSNLKAENLDAYVAIFKRMKPDVPDESKDPILENMMEIRLASEISTLLLRHEEGEVENLYGDINNLFEQHKKDAKITGIDYIRADIGELLKQDEEYDGLKFRLDCLNECMRPLRWGDFVVVAGRPDKGKTTFVASEVSFLAQQLLGEQTVVWLNNEGPGERIKQRVYQAAVGLTLSQMIEAHQRGELESRYLELMGMTDRVRVFDIHGMDTVSVERIIETNAAGVVVYDMLDNIRGFGDSARTDIRLERMYQWARELGVKYQCIGIATSQISADGDGLLFPTMHMLKDGKTGKQGACDVQIMIGASDEPGMQSIRGIGVVKNKLRREGKDQDPQARVMFKPQIARFVDVPMAEEDDEETGE
jgi:replicative DNA helicase